MADKESFPMWLMHAVDKMLAPKAKKEYPKLSPGEAKRFMRQSGAYDVPPSPDMDDDIAAQVERLKRRNAVFAAGSPDEWNK